MNFLLQRTLRAITTAIFLLLFFIGAGNARGEAMLQLFNVNWDELAKKMPEIAEAGYTSLWLPPPSKAGSVFSVGYDLFDPFDLGDKNQRGTIRTRYGTKEELLRAVETAHRFGLRVYFDNIMNHRGFDVPGYNASAPTNAYPGLLPPDFHLRTTGDGFFRNWDGISDFNNIFQVQNRPLSGLLDLATEPGGNNINFGATEGSVGAKISFVRQPNNRDYYMDTNLPGIGGPWRPFNGTNGVPIREDVNAYLIRAALWLVNETHCDGFRLDAVKHTPSGFFGDTSATPNGYIGGIQTLFDYVHGYGNNVTGNGYNESDDNRNSNFDTETSRNDALLFGEHLGEPPGFQEYLDRGMRLLNAPLHFQFNNILGNPNATLSGLDQRDYRPYSTAFTGQQSVLFAQSHDDANSVHRELQNAYNFMREGLGVIYSDGYNQSSAPDYFPAVANAPYLGEFGDNKMPDIAYLHHQLARGGTRSRWSDADIVAFERYDYRDSSIAADQTVALFAMNDNYGNPGDISFDDGVAQSSTGTFYECFPAQNSRGQGLVVSFPPGSVLVQLADSPGKERACTKLLVRNATQSFSEAQSTANDPNPVNRKIFIGSQTLAAGGGAIEMKVPSGGYVIYGYQWPEAGRASLQDAITFRQNGVDARKISVSRTDGVNGDANFNPVYPFKMRGSVDANGNVVRGVNITNRTYAIDIPILTNATFDIFLLNDASSDKILVKLDGGVDLNSQMGVSPTNGLDRRDNRPGTATDLYLGFEQSLHQFRNGPEKFAAKNIARNNIISLGAETYSYTLGGTDFVVNGAGAGVEIKTQTADFVFHDPTNNVTTVGGAATQRDPLNPVAGQAVDLWVKSGYQFQINKC
ncbi:MAG: alpha-amylase family glycosyl hydrolase, partial [Verrucomicrobiota bacterium]